MQIRRAGTVLAFHAALVINAAICNLITNETDPGERGFTFQHDLLSKFSQLHSLCQLADGDRVVQKVLCVGKIRIIRPIAADHIIARDVGKKLAQNVFMCLPCDGRTLRKDTILQQDRDPVQDMMAALVQIQNGQAIEIQFILICKTIFDFGAGPFFGEFQALCAVKALPIVIVFGSLAIQGMLYDLP